MDATRITRVVRGLLSAGIATFIALFFHVIGGGETPAWLGIVAPLILSAPLSVFLAGRSLSFLRMLVAVGVSQAMFHLMFSLGSTSGAVAASGHHAHSTPTFATGSFATGSVVTESIATGSATGAVGDGAMWVMHALAALVTTAMLFHAERVYRRLRSVAARVAEWVRRALMPELGAPVAPRVARLLPIGARLLVPIGFDHWSAPRRGPPLSFAVSS